MEFMFLVLVAFCIGRWAGHTECEPVFNKIFHPNDMPWLFRDRVREAEKHLSNFPLYDENEHT